MTKNLKTSENLILGYPTFGQMQVGSFLRAWTRCVSQLSFVGSSDSFPSLFESTCRWMAQIIPALLGCLPLLTSA